MIDDMIDLLKGYLSNDIVPLIDKSVREVREELVRLKARMALDRVFSLVTALNQIMQNRDDLVEDYEKIQEKISRITEAIRDTGDNRRIHEEFEKAEKKYMALQVVKNQDRTGLLSEWDRLRRLSGEPATLETKLHELEILVKTEETMRNKAGENLRLLRENATEKPKYADKEKRIRSLYETISPMRERIYQWIQILRDPLLAREQFASTHQGSGFKLEDYEKFVRAVGEYLGGQFEPVGFAGKAHDIKFFDIEKDTFTTMEDRQIPIKELSQGQSKITTLTGSFKKMDSDRKKIVLIDEIADLDPENLRNVKATLKQKFAEGSLMLAILVRPPREDSANIVEIKSW